MTVKTAKCLGLNPEEVLVASTGVIGRSPSNGIALKREFRLPAAPYRVAEKTGLPKPL